MSNAVSVFASLKGISREAKKLKNVWKHISYAAMNGKSAVLVPNLSYDIIHVLISKGFKVSYFEVDKQKLILIEWVECSNNPEELDFFSSTAAIGIQKRFVAVVDFFNEFYEEAKVKATKGLTSHSKEIEDPELRHLLADYLGTFEVPGCKVIWDKNVLAFDWSENTPDAKCGCNNCKSQKG